VFKFSAKVNV